jgi:hypothetical protein
MSGQVQAAANGAVSPLKVFEDARREIANANTVESVNRIVALATGLAAAARKATDREMEAEAEVLKFEAERRLGQLMKAQAETVGFNQGGRPKTGFSENPVSEKPPTLAEAGIDKNTAHRARRAAALSEAQFKEAAGAKREAALTRSKKGRKQLKSRPTESKAARAVSPKDTALFDFTAHVLDLAKRIAKHPAQRFAETAVSAAELAKLGKFFADLASLKRAQT